jgi:branched-chain amino acid transport system ATP-binding protein
MGGMPNQIPQVRGLSKFFGGLAAIHEVDFHVCKGEILSIIGPNGAGKTTLFHLLTGVHPPSRGEILFQGYPITHRPPYEIARRGIARTFQTTLLFGELTVLDNVFMGYRSRMDCGLADALLRTRHLQKEERKCLDFSQEVLSFTGLWDQRGNLAKNISQEGQKRLSISMALATKPKLLLLDEPTGGMITEETASLMGLFREIVKRGVTVCLIEHKMRVVMSVSDRIVVLNHGIKIAEGPPKEISQNQAVIEAYLGDDYRA